MTNSRDQRVIELLKAAKTCGTLWQVKVNEAINLLESPIVAPTDRPEKFLDQATEYAFSPGLHADLILSALKVCTTNGMQVSELADLFEADEAEITRELEALVDVGHVEFRTLPGEVYRTYFAYGKGR